MPWQTNPTFADDAILSASDLNKLSDNADFLYGRIQGINIPFSSVRIANLDLDANNNAWTMRHLHRYLHYSLTLNSGDIDGGNDLAIYIDGNGEVIESSPTALGTPQTWSGYIDLNGAPHSSIAVGDWYTIYVTADSDGTSVFTVDYLVESDATSI